MKRVWRVPLNCNQVSFAAFVSIYANSPQAMGTVLCRTKSPRQALNEPGDGASPALQSLQLLESIAEPMAAIHCLGLSGDYGLPPDLSGTRLASTLSNRLPALISSH